MELKVELALEVEVEVHRAKVHGYVKVQIAECPKVQVSPGTTVARPVWSCRGLARGQATVQRSTSAR